MRPLASIYHQAPVILMWALENPQKWIHEDGHATIPVSALDRVPPWSVALPWRNLIKQAASTVQESYRHQHTVS